jgi:hypothetical protein
VHQLLICFSAGFSTLLFAESVESNKSKPICTHLLNAGRLDFKAFVFNQEMVG